MTFGSCLSIGVAKSLKKIGGWKRVSSVQHNRIDQFVGAYIQKVKRPVERGTLDIVIKDKYKFTNVLQNQILGWELGKALPEKGDNLLTPMDAIKDGVDLVVFDNFPEIYFKTYSDEIGKEQLFLNQEYFMEIPKRYRIDENLLDEVRIIDYYLELIKFIRIYNPKCYFVFINFPVNLNPKKSVRDRAKLIEVFLERLLEDVDGMYIIPAQGTYRTDLSKANDIHHFTDRRYMDYALTTKGAFDAFCK